MRAAPATPAAVAAPTRTPRRARGFTLIELLVASALLAILAVIGWRGLDAVLTSRDRIVQRSDELQAMSVAFAQMDEDLRRSWPVRLLGLAVPTLTFRPTDAGMVLQLLREGGGASDPSRIERVAYRLRNGLLERGFGPLLAAPNDGLLGSASAPGGTLPLSDAPLVWQPLLRDVAAVRYRGWINRRGWVDAPTLAAAQAALAVQSAQAGLSPGAAAAAASASGAPPAGATTTGTAPGDPAGVAAAAAAAQAAEQRVLGVEIELLRGNGERYVRIFPVQD